MSAELSSARRYPRDVSGDVRRASAFALVGLGALVVPALAGQFASRTVAVLAAVPFVAVALLALFVVEEGPAFELFARPGDYEERRLYGLGGFALAAAGLAIVAVQFEFPGGVYVASVFVLTGGNVSTEAIKDVTSDSFLHVVGFAIGGTIAGVMGQVAASFVAARTLVSVDVPGVVFLAAVGALTGALLRSMLFERDDPLVMASVALLVWLFATLNATVPPSRLAAGLAVTAGLGYVAYRLETASVQGMLTGVLLALLAVVLGGWGWFILLVTFFGLGGLSTKYRYDEKLERGVAEENEGARGSGNVLANSAVALVAIIAFAASGRAGIPPGLFRFAFAGAVAAALADTFSSEIGGLFDQPRLLTNFQRVKPGTDGAVTWQGELAGLVGAGIIAGESALFFDDGSTGLVVIVMGGFVGMTVDSILGATIEGDRIGNEGVNFLATFAGGLSAAVGALFFGLT